MSSRKIGTFILPFLAPLLCSSLPAQPAEFLQAGAGACPVDAAFGQVVTLAGLARGGSVESYRWAQFDDGLGPPVVLSADDVPVIRFTAPDEAARLTFLLSVTGEGDRASDTVTIEVSEQGDGSPRLETSGVASGEVSCMQEENVPAVATVPAAVRVEGGLELTVGATDGIDPDDTRVFIGGLPRGGVSYQWSVQEGAGILTDMDLSDADTETVSFAVPPVEERTTVTLSLLVADVANCGTRYEVEVIVEPRPLHCPEIPPVALARVTGVANGQRVVRTGDEFSLDASNSGVPGNEAAELEYSWVQTGGGTVFMQDFSSARARVRVDEIQATALGFRVRVESELGFDEAEVAVPATPLFDLFFSQIAYGTAGAVEFASVPVLINDTDRAAEVSLEFFDQTGAPLALLLDGAPWNPGDTLVLPAQTARQLNFSAVSEESFSVGWGRVTSDVQLTGLVLYRLLDAATGDTSFELGLFSSPPGARFTTFYGRGDGLAMAVANPGTNVAGVRFELLENILGSQTTIAARTIALGPGEQVARFLDESFLGVLPEEFQSGTLLVRELEGRSIIGTVLKTDPAGFLTSTLPVAVQRGRSGVLADNRPPTATLQFRLGDGELQTAMPGQNVAVSAPLDIFLEAGASSDDLGLGNLNFEFNVQQNLQTGGAFITVVSETARTLEIAAGTAGTIHVMLTVTDSLDESDSVEITFEIVP